MKSLTEKRQVFIPKGQGEFIPVVAELPARKAIADKNILQAGEDEIPDVIDEVPLHRSFWDRITKKQHPRVRELEQQENLRKKDIRKLNKKPDRAYLITMRFSNGTQRTWVIISSGELFKYHKREYHLLTANSLYDLTNHCYHLVYDEDYTEPINKNIALLEDDTMPDGKKRAFFSVTPSNLKTVLRADLLRQLLDSQSLSKYMKLLVVLAFVNTFVSVIAIYMVTTLPKKIAPVVAQLVIAAIKAGAIK